MVHRPCLSFVVLLVIPTALAPRASSALPDRPIWADGEVCCVFPSLGPSGPWEVSLSPSGERAELTMSGRQVTAQVDERYSWVWAEDTGTVVLERWRRTGRGERTAACWQDEWDRGTRRYALVNMTFPPDQFEQVMRAWWAQPIPPCHPDCR
jgi:hypothetical protein